MEMLKHKVAVVFAASGQIAGAVARSFAQHGAKVYITARNLQAVINLSDEIKAAGGQAEAAKVDALNENEIDSYLQNVIADNGKLDIVFNGIGSFYRDAGSGTPSTGHVRAIPQSFTTHLWLAIPYLKSSRKTHDPIRIRGHYLAI